jgi:molybdate-binding protein/DNA-binding XRE family transcriptional regulator
MPEIDTSLAHLRRQRGFSAIELARLTGVSRQTIYAIEAGLYIPNTAVALRLARVLETTVEELFSLPDETPAPDLPIESATLLPGADRQEPGQTLQLCRVDQQLMASPPLPEQWYFPASDAVVVAGGPAQHTKVQIFHADPAGFRNRILVAGCDPAISVLARHVGAAGIELVLAHRNSSQSLKLLKDGCIHVAGTHLRDDSSGESNLPEISRLFAKDSVAVVTFAVWEEGIVTARGNPKSIRGIEDLARPDVTIVNRETGSGSRNLLDAALHRLKIDAKEVRGYGHTAPGHLPAAWQVLACAADCCISTRAAARVFGLGFIPMVKERYDLAIRTEHLELPGVQALLDTLNRSTFRRELAGLGGYDTTAAGKRIL